MLLSQAISLIQHDVPKEKIVCADLGCGDGLFTNALSQLLPQESLIYAVDKSKRALKNVTVKEGIQLEKLALNFVEDNLPLKNLSAILMANSFHFIKDKNAFINKAFTWLNKDGYLIMVEYDIDRSSLWVPYPISYNNLKKFFANYNYTVEKLSETPSKYRGTIYSAVIQKQ